MKYIHYSISIILIWLLPSFVDAQCSLDDQIKGISFRGSEKITDDPDMFSAISYVNANWVAIIPEATLIRSNLQIRPDHENHWWSETVEGAEASIKIAKQSNLCVMLKPQIVLEKIEKSASLLDQISNYVGFSDDKTSGAVWRGDFEARTEADWQLWESSYERHIMALAGIAETHKVDLFCIGTELRESVINRPQFWKSLILKVRKIYSGPITYSANWDEYQLVPFWNDLDYIGTNGYFPISSLATPNIATTISNWNGILETLETFSKQQQKQVIITEYGYRNVSYAGKEPWTHDKGGVRSNLTSQSNLYEAFYRATWNRDWILGGFAWNWNYKPYRVANTDFTVQNKPAQDILEKWYGM